MMVMDYDEFNKCYMKHGVCKECKQPNTGNFWCQSCNAKRFQQNFKNWTSGNHDIDEFIQNAQLKAKNYWNVLEWIEYDRFENVEYLTKSGFETTYKAIWKDGYIFSWDSKNNQWEKYKKYYEKGQPVTLKCLYDSQDITDEFLKKINSHLIRSDSFVVPCYGITKHPESNNFMMAFNMEEIKLSDDIIDQIKDFYHQRLTKEQELLIDKLILNKELKKHYKEHGLCKECKQPNTGKYWCQSCNAKHFQRNFDKWTSRNHNIDNLIQNAQLKAKNYEEVLEWIDYDRFEHVEYLAKGGFGTVYKATWKDSFITNWDSENNRWNKCYKKGSQIILKCLHISQDNTIEFLREIESYCVTRCYGIIKDPETNNFMMVMDYDVFNKYYIKHGVCKECKQPNTGSFWCQSCNAEHFKQNFKNWTSGNHYIDEFIQNSQLKTKNYWNLLEWIEYDRFENVEYLAKSGFEDTYKAIWKDGYIFSWNSKNNQWERYKKYYENGQPVTLKCLHDSQDITDEFFRKINSHLIRSDFFVVPCCGITKHPELNNFMIAFNMEEIKLSDDVFEQIKDFCHGRLTEEQESLIDILILNEEFKNHYKKYGLCKGCRQPKTVYKWCQSCEAKYFQQNFQNWTSGSHNIDKFIQNAQLNAKNHEEALEWIEYERFEHVKYLAKGGFGTIYKATWKDGPIGGWNSKSNELIRRRNEKVALKCLHNSQDITVEFLNEINNHLKMSGSFSLIIRCYGITKDPETNNFMIVMQYIENGSLRQYLNSNSFNSLDWARNSRILVLAARGLKNIHEKGLIHHDFHCGNILFDGNTYITDLGLCQPANIKPSQSNNKKIYGVLPYVAPEVLRGKEYTQASNIYAFGIIAYEVYTGLPPYHDIAHDEFLAIRICQGLRPNSNYKIPQLIFDIIKQCWDADPLRRPKVEELHDLLFNLYDNLDNRNSLIYNIQCNEANEINCRLSSAVPLSLFNGLSYATHPQAVYTSKLLDFKNLPEPKNADSEYSEELKLDFTKSNNNSKDEGN